MTTIERIEAILRGASYKELGKRFAVSSVPFEFAAAFIGAEKALDLIVVIDLFQEKEEARLVQKMQSLGRALDLAESRRSLTAVLVGAGLDPSSLEAIGRVCRILAVGTPPDDGSVDQYLHDWLAVLLPLPIMEEVSALADWRAEIAHQAQEISTSPFFGSVIEVAHHGSDSVEKTFAVRLQKEVAKALREHPQ